MKKYEVIGLMSGTSLDGLDIAYCSYSFEENKWKYKIHNCETIEYEIVWKNKLKNAHKTSGYELIQLDREYGRYIADQVNSFLLRNKIAKTQKLYISSHGHTVFHMPEQGITFQLGDGSMIAGITGLTTINNFRVLDVSLEGEGAPLVPIGDKLLFSDFDYCINMGGFANISFDIDGKRIGYDICAVNILLNKLAEETGKQYDDKGVLASEGIVCDEMLMMLIDEDTKRKSLSREWVENKLIPIINKFDIEIKDKLRTVTEYISEKISRAIIKDTCKVIITGGGAYNEFLLNKIREKTKTKIHIPEKEIIEYKEAMIFGFLGVLRLRGEINCLSSVTGSKQDNSGGTIWKI